MAGRRWWRVRAALVVIAALGISLRVGAAAFALTPPTATPLRDDCNPCVTIVDAPAYDESVTVVDRAAYDEQVTVVDTPASSATRTIVDVPAHTVSHHDLVTAAYTVARQVLVTPGHYAIQPAVVPGHYEQGPNQLVSRGYYQSVWVTSGEYRSVWVPSGYWTSQWQSSGYWGTQWVYDGYYGQAWQPAYYVPWRCWGGPDGDCDGDYWQPGYYYTGWINTSHYASVWIDTSHWVSVYIDTSSYQTQWFDTSHWGQQWIDTSYTVPTQVWVGATSVSTSTFVPAGYVRAGGCGWSRIDDEDYCWDPYWVSTPFWVSPATIWVDPVYTTVYDVIPAVYNDWTESVPAVTHTETYVIPAVTHQTTVHHDAVTHLTTIHHDAVTHQAQAAALTTESRQGADPSTAGPGTGTTAASTPVTIPVVSTITLIDSPATTKTVTVVDQPAYDEQRTIVTQAAYDQTVSTPVWVDDCEDRCYHYIDHYDTSVVHHDAVLGTQTVHHDAVTHTATVTSPAVTHTENLRYDAIVGSPTATAGQTGSSDNGDNGLLGFATLLGLVALGGAGRYATRSDVLRTALAEWSAGGVAVPDALATVVSDGTVTDADTTKADAIIAAAVAKADSQTATETPSSDVTRTPGDPGELVQPRDTPPNGSELDARARAQFEAWVKADQQNKEAVANLLLGEGIIPAPQTAADPQTLEAPQIVQGSLSVGFGPFSAGRTVQFVPETGQIYVTTDFGAAKSSADGLGGSLMACKIVNAPTAVPDGQAAKQAWYDGKMTGWSVGASGAFGPGGSVSVGPDTVTVCGGAGTPGAGIGFSYGETLQTVIMNETPIGQLVAAESSILSMDEQIAIGAIDLARGFGDNVASPLLSFDEQMAIGAIDLARGFADNVELPVLKRTEDLAIGAIQGVHDIQNAAGGVLDWLGSMTDAARAGLGLSTSGGAGSTAIANAGNGANGDASPTSPTGAAAATFRSEEQQTAGASYSGDWGVGGTLDESTRAANRAPADGSAGTSAPGPSPDVAVAVSEQAPSNDVQPTSDVTPAASGDGSGDQAQSADVQPANDAGSGDAGSGAGADSGGDVSLSA